MLHSTAIRRNGQRRNGTGLPPSSFPVIATPSVAADHNSQRGSPPPRGFGKRSSHPAPATRAQPAIVLDLLLSCSLAPSITTAFTSTAESSAGLARSSSRPSGDASVGRPVSPVVAVPAPTAPGTGGVRRLSGLGSRPEDPRSRPQEHERCPTYGSTCVCAPGTPVGERAARRTRAAKGNSGAAGSPSSRALLLD